MKGVGKERWLLLYRYSCYTSIFVNDYGFAIIVDNDYSISLLNYFGTGGSIYCITSIVGKVCCYLCGIGISRACQQTHDTNKKEFFITSLYE